MRQMFRRHLIDGWGYFRIASELNQQGIVSPTGKQWNPSAVQAVLENRRCKGEEGAKVKKVQR